MRAAAVFAVLCLCGAAHAQWTTVFEDSFDRPDGPIGPNYQAVPGLPHLNITNHVVCASTQSVALWKGSVAGASMVRLTHTFFAQSDEGFESYGIAFAGEVSLSAGALITGCDGGYDQTCTATVKNVSTNVGARVVPGLPLSVQQGYTITTVIDTGSDHAAPTAFGGSRASTTVTVAKNASTTPLSTLVATGQPDVGGVSHAGFLVGRAAPASCVTWFRVEVQ